MAQPRPDTAAAVVPDSSSSTDSDGDFRAELGTMTEMQDDGRVGINLTESNVEKLAQQIRENRIAIQHLESDAGLGCGGGTTQVDERTADAPLPLNVVIQVVGSRGDVQPFVALGLVLKKNYGHRVRLATHGTFRKFVEENGLEFFDIGGDPAELMAFMVKNPNLIPGIQSLRDGDVGRRRKGMAEILDGCWRSCADNLEISGENDEAGSLRPFIANAIIANPPSFAHIHCAEKLGIPLHLMFTMPWSPTEAFPHPLANIKSASAGGSMANEMSYSVVDMMTWEGLGHITNKFRHSIDLGSLPRAPATTMIHRLRIPHTYCWSPALIPKPKDWGDHINIAGFYFLSLGTSYDPEPALCEFLESGPPPVYIGFGSIVVEDPNGLTKLIFEAVEKTGQRALVSKGWGGIGGGELSVPKGVFMLGNCPHDWLFQRVSCVVHHGGAGTTAAGIALGCPTVVVPFFGDQPFWGNMVARAGAGPDPIPFKELTSEKLASAVLEALKPETLERAKTLGERIREEKGCEVGAASFQRQLNTDKLRCVLRPDRPAVWQVRGKDPNAPAARLSALAASILCDEEVIGFDELTLYRPKEYKTRELSLVSSMSGPNPVLQTMGTVTSHVVHWPIELGKAWAGLVYEPYKGAKKDSWRGFGKGLGKGLTNFLFPSRGTFLTGARFTSRGIYKAVKRRFGSGSNALGFVIAAHIAQGYEEAQDATEEERRDIVEGWKKLRRGLESTKS